jgi:hypothetical protein
MKPVFFHTTIKFVHISLNKFFQFSAEEKAKRRIDYKTPGEKWTEKQIVFFLSNKKPATKPITVSTC